MNDFVARYFLFLAEVVTVALAIVGVGVGVLALSARRSKASGRIQVTPFRSPPQWPR